MRQEDEAGGPQDTGKAQEPEGSAEKAGSKKDKYQKAQAKAEHAGEKLGKAREKLDKTEAKRAAKKPPGLAKKAVRGARTEAWFYLHNKIHEVEHENVGVEGAHKSELVAEAGARKLTRYAKRRWREHPARKVAKWERKDIKARTNVDFQKMASEHPELASNPLSRVQQKWKLKRRYSKEAKAAAKQGAKAAKKTAAASGTATRRAAQFVTRHPVAVLVLLLLLLLCFLVSAVSSIFPTLGSGLANALSGTSYASEDTDLLGVDEDYTALENELAQTVANIESTHPGYDEYRYSVDEIGHNPYELASYLSAKYHVYFREQVQDELREIFEAQYELTLKDWVEEHRGYRKYVAIAGKCWPAFQTQFGFVPCYVNSRLTGMGIPVSCEVDIYGALSEFIGTCVSQDAVTLLDINNTVPNDMYKEDIEGKFPYTQKDTFMGFHCGNTASCKLSFCEMRNQKIMARSLPVEVTNGTLEGDIMPGDITFFRLQSTADAQLRAYIAHGEVLPVATRSFGSIGIFAIPEMGRFYRHVLIEKNFPHHGAVAFGHYGKALYEVFKYIGVPVEEIGYNQPAGVRYPTENPF